MTEQERTTIRQFREAVARLLTALNNPGGQMYAMRNKPGTPYHDLVLAGMELDTMLNELNRPARRPCDCYGGCESLGLDADQYCRADVGESRNDSHGS